MTAASPERHRRHRWQKLHRQRRQVVFPDRASLLAISAATAGPTACGEGKGMDPLLLQRERRTSVPRPIAGAPRPGWRPSIRRGGQPRRSWTHRADVTGTPRLSIPDRGADRSGVGQIGQIGSGGRIVILTTAVLIVGPGCIGNGGPSGRPHFRSRSNGSGRAGPGRPVALPSQVFVVVDVVASGGGGGRSFISSGGQSGRPLLGRRRCWSGPPSGVNQVGPAGPRGCWAGPAQAGDSGPGAMRFDCINMHVQ